MIRMEKVYLIHLQVYTVESIANFMIFSVYYFMFEIFKFIIRNIYDAKDLYVVKMNSGKKNNIIMQHAYIKKCFSKKGKTENKNQKIFLH